MDIVAYLALIIVLTYLLVKAADLVEDAFVLIAKKLNLSSFLIGFVVLGIASTLPEISIVLTSSIQDRAEISIGNILGASLVTITLVIAINVFMHKKIPFKGSFGVNQVIAGMGLILSQVIVLLDGQLTSTEGAVLIGMYIFYVIYISFRTNHLSKKHLHENAKIEVGQLSILLGKGLIGLFGLLIFATGIVSAATYLADLLHISDAVVGILILSLGTNIPELTIIIRSHTKDQEKLAVGNFIGSAAVNTAVLGLLGVLNIPGIEVDSITPLIPVLSMLSLGILFFAIFAWTGREITRREAIVLMSLYIGLIIIELIVISSS